MKKILAFIRKYPLVIPLVLFILLRIPSLFEGYWYGDEGIHAALAQGIREGKSIFTQVWDHKPPLQAWIYYLASFGGWDTGLFLVKFASMAFGAWCIFYLGKISKIISDNKWFPFAVGIFIAITLGGVVLEGDVANAEVFFILFNILIFYFLLKSKKPYLVGGLLLLAFLSKPQSCIEGAILLGVWSIARILNKQSFVSYILKVLAACLLPLGAYLVLLVFQNNFGGFIDAVVLQNFVYATNSDPGLKILGITYSSKLIIGLVFISILAVSTWLCKQKKISFNGYLVINFFNAELVMVLFGGRTYPHYLIQLLPGLALIFAWLLLQYKPWTLDFYKNIAMFVLISMLTLFLFLYKGSTLSTDSFFMVSGDNYYVSFMHYLFTADKANFREGYSVWRGTGNSKRLTDFADYFNSRYSGFKNCYFYTDEAWLVALSKVPTTNKYVVAYHLGFGDQRLQEGIKLLGQSECLVVDTKVPEDYPAFLTNLDRFTLLDQQGDFQIYKTKGSSP